MKVSVKILPLDVYADGKWYNLPEKKRKKLRPLVINNNWVLGKFDKDLCYITKVKGDTLPSCMAIAFTNIIYQI